jgi:Subtilisin inhibitor-like
MRALFVAAAVLALAAAGSAASRTTVDAKLRAAERTALTITVWPKGRGTGRPSKRWTLSCDPAGGTLPRRVRSCTSLASLANAFAPVPGDVACTEIYGGPAQALVTGRRAGRRVWARFHRSDGCHIDRWNRHRFLFPVSV